MLIKELKKILADYDENVNVRIIVQGKVANLTHYEEAVIPETQEVKEIHLADKEITDEYFETFEGVS